MYRFCFAMVMLGILLDTEKMKSNLLSVYRSNQYPALWETAINPKVFNSLKTLSSIVFKCFFRNLEYFPF